MKQVNIEKLDRRATKTLVAWWGRLNAREWPREFGPEETYEPIEHMNAIQMELGRRTLRRHRWGQNRAAREAP